MLPGMDKLFPDSANAPALQGAYTVKVLAGCAAVSLVFAIIGALRHKPTTYDD